MGSIVGIALVCSLAPAIVGIALVCSLAPETLGVFSGSCTGDQNIDLKQIGCQIFLQQR